MKKITEFVCLTFALLLCSTLMAQKPMPARNFEISLKKDETIKTVYKGNQRINVATGFPIADYGLAVPVTGNSPEEMAWNYLLQNGKTLGLGSKELPQLKHHVTRNTNAGSVVRYRQIYNNVPVNKSEVTLAISPESKVVYVMNSFSYKVEKSLSTVSPSISLAAAKSAAKSYLPIEGNITYEDARLMVYQNNKTTRLAYEITILSAGPLGEWHVFVDAQTSEIFKVEDQAFYYCKHNDKDHDHSTCSDPPNKTAVLVADGTGLVFNPDPLSSNQVAYGGNYVDNNDVNSAELDAARFSVTLNDIEFANNQYTLRGPYAEVVDFDAPATGLFQQASSTFNYNREDQPFEAVNTYYHIDYMMRYINLTLGCNVVPYQYSGGVQYDPHGANGADNSYYSSGAGQLSFGEGCVDDAEDSDVIHHELGHGLHDWVTAGGLSQADGLSEGCGDYVAQSYNRSLGNWTPSDPAYNWVFNWDGHNECWNGRITNHNVGYPGGLSGSIHTDGQIWASCLMEIWDEIGQQRMDKIFYEGLGMTNGSSNQNDAANAVYQAALNLNYTQAEITAIHAGLTSCGYTLPLLAVCNDNGGDADNDGICADVDCNDNDDTVGIPQTAGTTCDDKDPSTENDMIQADGCTCQGTPVVCTSITTPGQGLSSSNGTSACINIPFAAENINVTFDLSAIESVTGGNPNNRYIDQVTVQYVDINSNTQTHQVYTANATVSIPGPMTALIVCIEDADGNTGRAVDALIGDISSCEKSSCPVIIDLFDPVTQGLYQADQEVNCHAPLDGGTIINFRAGNIISLESGTEIPASTNFDAIIEGCENN